MTHSRTIGALPVDLTGMRVAITAGASGIGLATARIFAERGARVLVSDIDAAAVADAAEIDGIEAITADAGDADQVEAMFDTLRDRLGGLDVLINNAGIAGPIGGIETLDPEAVDRTFRVNNTAQFICSRHAVPLLREAGGGLIVNLSSAAGRLAFRNRTAYSAAKWGVVGFTRSLALELGRQNIRVNAILPGHVNGPRFRQVWSARAEERGISFDEMAEEALQYTCLGSTVEMNDIGNMAAFLASPFGEMITGQSLCVCAGIEMLG